MGTAAPMFADVVRDDCEVRRRQRISRARLRERKRVAKRKERPDPEPVSVRLTGRAAGVSRGRKDEVCV